MPDQTPTPTDELRARWRTMTAARTSILDRLVALHALQSVELPRYEQALVIAARRAGITWETMGEATGRQRQSVQRQHGAAVARAMEADA